jgi:6-phosphogluconolactonase/glucosamine-6-phosphate isomerase/deaminase
MPAMESEPDVAYERELVEVLGMRGAGRDRLDFVLLGMGADGHTASLFPRSPALKEMRRLVRVNEGPTVTPPARVTMTYPLLNSARFVAVLATGAGKRETLKRVAATAAGTDLKDDASRLRAAEELPILGVRPMAGEMRWYVDGEAGR